MKLAYLDNSATTAVCPQAIDKATYMMRECFGNPSSLHAVGFAAERELEEARRELEEKQQQRDEAFREAERENAALPEEEEKQKKPAGSKAADAAPTELVLPQREARTGSPVRYILIGALLAGALCIAIYLFTHPAREDDPADETKS